MKKLTPKIQRFADEYLIDLNATAAALRAGYAAASAHSQAHDLLKKPEVAAYIAKRAQKAQDRKQIEAEDVLEEARRLAFSDVRRLFDKDGALLPPSEWPDEVAAAVAGIESVVRHDPATRLPVRITKVRLWPKTPPLELLMKHLELLRHIIELRHSGEITQKYIGVQDADRRIEELLGEGEGRPHPPSTAH